MDDVVSPVPANGMYFELRNGNWWAIWRASGISVEADTGVTENNGFYTMLQIERNASTGKWGYYIDRTLRASLANPNQNQFTAMNLAIEVAGSGSVTFMTDYASICLTAVNRYLLPQ